MSIPLEGSLASLRPDLVKFFAPESPLKPHEVTPGSGRLGIFQCPQGHRWEKPIRGLVKAATCPICTGRQVLSGVNDLATVAPEVAALWDGGKNGKNPSEVTLAASEYFFWRCTKEGHSFSARARGVFEASEPCPYCGMRKVLGGFNSVRALREDLLPFWAPKNELSPEEVHVREEREVLWRCSEGHEFSSRINRMEPFRCLLCTGYRLTPGVNDLATTHPEFLPSWDHEENSKRGLTPEGVVRGSNLTVSWRCPECEHRWETILRNRTTTSCPSCSSWGTSFLEGEVGAYLTTLTGEKPEERNRALLGGLEVDFYFPSLGIALEVNGDYWHGEERSRHLGYGSSQERHLKKELLAKEQGVTLGFLWESSWKLHGDEVEAELRAFLEEGCRGPLLRRLEPPEDGPEGLKLKRVQRRGEDQSA